MFNVVLFVVVNRYRTELKISVESPLSNAYIFQNISTLCGKKQADN
jgi:hypothetical protein